MVIEKHVENPAFLCFILFTDEAGFTRNVIINFYDEHVWSKDNPHTILQSKYQQQSFVNAGKSCGRQSLGTILSSSSIK